MSRETLNLARAISRFEDAHSRSLAPASLLDYTRSLAILEDALGRDTDPATITTSDAEQVLASQRFDGLSPTTVGKIMSAWVKFSAWGRRRHGWEDWARDLERPRRAKPMLRRLTRGEVAAMLVEPTLDEWDRTVVWLVTYTGFRRSELRSIRWGDIDLVDATLRLELGKGRKGRMVPLPRVLVTYLAQTKERRPPEHVVDEAYVIPSVKTWTPPGSELVRRIDPTAPASPQAVWRAVKRAARAAGLRSAHEVTPHMFRRHLLEDRNEATQATIIIADIAGHADVRTTQGYTGQTSMAAMRRVMDTLDFLEDS